VVLFVDRMYAKTLHFLAEPVHLDSAWAERSAIEGTLIHEILDSKWTGEVAVLYRSADSAKLRNMLNHRTMRYLMTVPLRCWGLQLRWLERAP
jgi:hypothetical protein